MYAWGLRELGEKTLVCAVANWLQLSSWSLLWPQVYACRDCRWSPRDGSQIEHRTTRRYRQRPMQCFSVQYVTILI